MGVTDTMRAPIFVPATRPERFAKAASSGADAVILDLEDSVLPEDKDDARQQLIGGFGEQIVLVRINAHGMPWHEADLAAISAIDLDGVIVPKAEDPATLARIAATLPEKTALLALIETARGLANARDIAATAGVTRLVFGSVDYCADLNMDHERSLLQSARSELVLASRLAGIAAPVDGVTLRIDDLGEIASDARHAKALGMTGKLCIHPAQIESVLSAFGPSQVEIDWAK
ncbi:HpcH/HpaI aldolase/citrate lyase family protein [Sinisalibacter aestuarii]|uniref:Citryl-CoA lyase n=1 Tax=Sinisalibacter aestuarii TaxID=2949426 RepID=A0ABQ5LY14_9RHOB|nr:CoA ester lyase [Sinisalibacter aestuarii]GKY89141.1 citryl-CoA lyase [Sinisalibacter aestuarii]